MGVRIFCIVAVAVMISRLLCLRPIYTCGRRGDNEFQKSICGWTIRSLVTVGIFFADPEGSENPSSPIHQHRRGQHCWNRYGKL